MTDAYPDRVEVITSVQRRRRWSVEEKLRIVAESLRPEVSVRSIARRYEVNANQLFTWRRLAREGAFGGTGGFVPVRVVDGPERERGSCPGFELAAGDDKVLVAEISFPNGCRLRVESGLEQVALSRLVATLLAAG